MTDPKWLEEDKKLGYGIPYGYVPQQKQRAKALERAHACIDALREDAMKTIVWLKKQDSIAAQGVAAQIGLFLQNPEPFVSGNRLPEENVDVE